MPKAIRLLNFTPEEILLDEQEMRLILTFFFPHLEPLPIGSACRVRSVRLPGSARLAGNGFIPLPRGATTRGGRTERTRRGELASRGGCSLLEEVLITSDRTHDRRPPG